VAGLAGGVLVCCSSAVCADAIRPEDLPVEERQLASAVKTAFAGEADVEPRLRLSTALLMAPVVAEPPRQLAFADDVPVLRMSPHLSTDSDESPAPRQPMPARPEAPLRPLPAGGGPGTSPTAQRFTGMPEDPLTRRPARTQMLPGVAGNGQPPPQGAAKIALAVEESEGGPAVFAAAPPAPGAYIAQPAADEGLVGTGWEIPPIRLGGSVGYSIQSGSSNSGNSNRAQSLFANISASSYIYAPWFATVSGRLGFVNSSTSTSNWTSPSASTPAPAASGGDTNRSSNIVGGGEVNLLSSTRFPFRAYFDRSDNRANGNFVNQDYINTRYGLTQNYRSEDSMSSGSFYFDRSAIQNVNGANNDVSAFSGNYSKQIGIWQHNLNGRYSLGERQGTKEMARLLGINTSHSANFSDTANLTATVNFSDNDLRTSDSIGGFFTNRGRFLLANAYGSWMPEFEELDDLPLTLTGSMNYSGQETSFGGINTTSQLIGGNLSALYRYSQNLSASVNTALNHISMSTGDSRLLTLVGSSANYVGDSLNIGKFSYIWNVGGNANWQSGVGETPANTMLGANATHSLARVYSLEGGRNLSLSFAQTLTANNSKQIGTSESLSNNLSANYGVYSGENFSGTVSGMFSDVYTTGVTAQHYKSFNLGFFGQGQISQQSSLNLNLAFNWTDQTNQTLDAFGVPQTANDQRMTLNGSVNYNHQRFAGVRGLRYNLIFAADNRLRDDRLFGNFNTEQERSRYTLTNRLDYQIGLLDFRLLLLNNEVGGKKNALLFFQVSRQIGSY